MISPTTNCFSKIINKPAKISSIKLYAPKLNASPIIPAPARSVGVSTPHALKIRKKATINDKYLIKLDSNLPIVSFGLFGMTVTAIITAPTITAKEEKRFLIES
jgi:hypothetical protein